MQNPNPIHYVETEEEEEDHDKSNNAQTAKQQTELQLGDDSSPPSSSSSDPAAESGPILNSVLRQLITCGGAGAQSKKSHYGLRIKAMSRLALTSRAEEEEEIKCMSENPRFGKAQGEEKEYFSGSIVEAMASAQQRSVTEPRLKKSSSFNEERCTSSKAGIGDVEEQDGGGGGGGGGCVKGKCIPGRKKSFHNK
ncbi:putative protein SOSEKI [Dioscorea sansibarensis]